MRRLNNVKIWKLLTFVLLATLVYTLFLDNKTFRFQLEGEKKIVATANAKELYKEFVCACCGQDIGECTCGMAEERRGIVDTLVSAGVDENGVRKEMVRKYGEEILFDQDTAQKIKEQITAEAPEDRPIIEITPKEVDLGEVSMNKGVAETIFRLKNAGSLDLEITGMETSCMCTTVKLNDSPIFGMHDNPTDWSATLKAGEEAPLIVIFDPNAHGPGATGPITRTITVFSNDPVDSKTSIKIEANIIK